MESQIKQKGEKWNKIKHKWLHSTVWTLNIEREVLTTLFLDTLSNAHSIIDWKTYDPTKLMDLNIKMIAQADNQQPLTLFFTGLLRLGK